MPGYQNSPIPMHPNYYTHPYPPPTQSPLHNPYANPYFYQQYGYQQPESPGAQMAHRPPYPPQDYHRPPMYHGRHSGYGTMPYSMPPRPYPQPDLNTYGNRMEQPQPQHPQQPMVVSSGSYGHPYSPIARASPAPVPPMTPRQAPPPLSEPSMPTPPLAAPPVRESESLEEQRRPSQPAVQSSVTSIEAATVTSPALEPALAESAQATTVASPLSPRPGRHMPFSPSLPWYSCPPEKFPARTRQRRRRRSIELTQQALEVVPSVANEHPEHVETAGDKVAKVGGPMEASESTELELTQRAEPSEAETPVTSQAPSEPSSTVPTTPSSTLPPSTLTGSTVPKKTHTRNPTIPAIPLVPIKPAQRKGSASTITSTTPAVQKLQSPAPAVQSLAEPKPDYQDPQEGAQSAEDDASKPAPEPVKAAPKSWADLMRRPTNTASATLPAPVNGAIVPNGFTSTKASTVAEVLSSFSVTSEGKIPFLKPRGLVNTGNMCYMNSILQVLVFCVPFYEFLDEVGKNAVHSFKSETPLLDAMIMFMREFSATTSASSIEQLRLRLREEDLEEIGEPFNPEYVHDVTKGLPRFSHFKRGHQQDAEEFLGFLLEELQDECANVLRSINTPYTNGAISSAPAASGGWQEVGPKQKASVTRSSGATVPTPITKLFGGQLRSEFRVPGLKNSVTLEPYKPLQLDIGAVNISNIIDALKGLTRSETITGDFNSPRGPGTSATKQMFIETLPPVLILHLKRFQYDSSGGTQKIYKRVGYPLELEIPKEVFPPAKRNTIVLNNNGVLPRYKLTAVVYHHGKNASGGHYTVDIRRQDGKEWIRMDDTIIRRVRPEDVAEGGTAEDPKLLAKALEQHKRDASNSRANIYDAVADDEENEEDTNKGEWKDAKTNGKKWATVANGTGSGKRTPVAREVKDNKVAYILVYQEIKP